MVKPLYEHMKAVEDPRSMRAKKHELAEVLSFEKNRDRYEYRDYRILNNP